MVVTTGDYGTVTTGDVTSKEALGPDHEEVHWSTCKNVPEANIDWKSHAEGKGCWGSELHS